MGNILPSLTIREKVVLLHGLGRGPASMNKLEKELINEGYAVANIGYPSRKYTIEELSAIVRQAIEAACANVERIHIVTHSLGGILVRYIQRYNPLERLGRVVMLSPPNNGSEIVDILGRFPAFGFINGPAGLQLGTGQESFVANLGEANFELGVITGDRSINWFLSMMIPGKNDGKVSIDSAKVAGMKEFKIVHASHPFIMKKRDVIDHVVNFLKSGRF